MIRSSKYLVAPATLFAAVSFSSCTSDLTCESGWCGTVVVASAPVQSLFPPNPRLDVDLGIYDLIFSKLADVGPTFSTVGDADFVPGLASSWSFEDDLTLRISLNPLATWHDGVPVTAEDVVFTFAVYQNPIVNSDARSRVAAVESVTEIDSLTVAIRFSRSYPEQFYDAVSHVHILPSHILEAVPPEDLGSHAYALHPIGSGPYRVVSWTPGEVVDLAADSTHFLGRPGVPRMIWRAVAGPTAGVDEMLADRADFLHHVGEPADLDRLREAAHVRLVEYPSNTYNYVGFNVRDPADESRPHPLFGSREMRRAIVMCVDRAALMQAVMGEHAIPLAGPVTPALSIWDENMTDGIPFDTVSAHNALARMGWSDSNDDGLLDRDGDPLEFDLLVPPVAIRARGALVLQEQLSRSGIRMNIVDAEWAAFFDMIGRGAFDAQYSSLGQDPSPAALATDWTEDGFNEFNVGKYSNPEYTRLVRQARDGADRANSRSRWHAALQIINDDAPAIWLYIPKKYAAVHERFDDFFISPYQPWIGLSTIRVRPSELIERDLYGVN